MKLVELHPSLVSVKVFLTCPTCHGTAVRYPDGEPRAWCTRPAVVLPGEVEPEGWRPGCLSSWSAEEAEAIWPAPVAPPRPTRRPILRPRSQGPG